MSITDAQAIYPEIESRADLVVPLTVPAMDLRQWLEREANVHSLPCLLAYTLDGVIWGKLHEGKLQLGQSVYTLPFVDDMLQEARLFGSAGEIYIWRSGDAWYGRFIRTAQSDEQATYIESIDETQMLWGDQVESRSNGFSVMRDGIQGLQHAVPCTVPDPPAKQATENNPKQYKERPLRLVVRHYLAQEDVARIVTSRLVALTINGEECSHD
jgi:CRISPR-associated protein (TIGR03984 family)